MNLFTGGGRYISFIHTDQLRLICLYTQGKQQHTHFFCSTITKHHCNWKTHTKFFPPDFLSHFTLMLFIIGSPYWAGTEWQPWQYPEVGVQWGRHDQALWRGHRCNGHLCHIRGGDIQRLCFTGCSNPPHLSKNKQISKWFCYFLPHESTDPSS